MVPLTPQTILWEWLPLHLESGSFTLLKSSGDAPLGALYLRSNSNLLSIYQNTGLYDTVVSKSDIKAVSGTKLVCKGIYPIPLLATEEHSNTMFMSSQI